MTPNDIEVLIHCYVTPAPHPRAHAPAVQEAITRFLRDGLIYQAVDNTYHTTLDGAKLFKRLCNVQTMVDLKDAHRFEYDQGSWFLVLNDGSRHIMCEPNICVIDNLESQIKAALQNYEPGLPTVERVKRLRAKCTTPDNHAWHTAQATINGIRVELQMSHNRLQELEDEIKEKDAYIKRSNEARRELEAKLAIMQDGYDKLLKEHAASDAIAKSFGKDLALVNIHAKAYLAVNETQVEAITEYNKCL